MTYGESADWSGYFKVIADGKIIYTSPEITKTSAPINFNVNITGCNHLEIEFSEYKNSFNNNIEICLGNAGFYQ